MPTASSPACEGGPDDRLTFIHVPMSQTRHFSSLRKRIEALFVPGLKLRVDCFAFANRTQWSEMKVPRYTVKLDREIIWDFPRDLPIKDVSP